MSSIGIYPKFHATDPSTGQALTGGKLYTYAAGTTTPLATYADAGLTTPNANPVVLDSNGEALLYMGPLAYKFVLQNSLGVQLWSVDNYAPNIATIFPGAQWYPYPNAAFYQTSVSFTTAGDQTAIFGAGLRLRSSNTAGTVYSTVVSASYAGGVTTVTVVSDGTSVLDSGFSALAYSLLPYSPSAYLDPRSAVCATTSGGLNGIGTALTTIPFATEIVDALSEFSPTTHAWTPRYPGKHLVTMNAQIETSASAIVTLSIANNWGFASVSQQTNIPTATFAPLSVSQIIDTSSAGAGSVTGTIQFSAGASNQLTSASLTISRIP